MPFINGKFYMNPAYGRALENVRANGPTDEDQGGHRVTIKGHHVLIEEAQGGRTQHNNPKHAGHSVNRANSKPGIKAARIIFNETSGLQPANRNSVDLHDARVAMAHARSNGESMSHPPSTVSDTLTSTASRAILTDAKARLHGRILLPPFRRLPHHLTTRTELYTSSWTIKMPTVLTGQRRIEKRRTTDRSLMLRAEAMFLEVRSLRLESTPIRTVLNARGANESISVFDAGCSVFFLLLPALGRQNHHRITAKEIAALKTAILDEIYDYGFEDEYTDISLLTPSGYELGLYVRPNVDNGEGQVIYKLPVGEVARIFQLNGDLAILIRDPRDKFPPTSSSTLTLYLRDEDICADKRNWIHEMLLIDPHPSTRTS